MCEMKLEPRVNVHGNFFSVGKMTLPLTLVLQYIYGF